MKPVVSAISPFSFTCLDFFARFCGQIWDRTKPNSIHVSLEVISLRVGNEIFRSRFLGAVVQFTRFLGNDVIKTLASSVTITFP